MGGAWFVFLVFILQTVQSVHLFNFTMKKQSLWSNLDENPNQMKSNVKRWIMIQNQMYDFHLEWSILVFTLKIMFTQIYKKKAKCNFKPKKLHWFWIKSYPHKKLEQSWSKTVQPVNWCSCEIKLNHSKQL